MIICSALSKDISELNLSLDTINMINIAFIHAYFNKKEGRSNGNIPQNRPDHHAACLASALSRIYLRYTSSMPFSLLCCLGSGSASRSISPAYFSIILARKSARPLHTSFSYIRIPPFRFIPFTPIVTGVGLQYLRRDPLQKGHRSVIVTTKLQICHSL